MCRSDLFAVFAAKLIYAILKPKYRSKKQCNLQRSATIDLQFAKLLGACFYSVNIGGQQIFGFAETTNSSLGGNDLSHIGQSLNQLGEILRNSGSPCAQQLILPARRFFIQL
jgi:hypothetical protein